MHCAVELPRGVLVGHVGCHLDCAMFQDVSSNRSFVVEFVDVGGGSHGYAASRDIFIRITSTLFL